MFQIGVMANDLGEPSLSSTAAVTVNVVRNSFAPEFTPPQYAQNIDFTKAVDEAVEQVTARDRDENVSVIHNSRSPSRMERSTRESKSSRHCH